MKKEITAIIVARKGSKRIPSKSLLKLNNESLIERKINQLKKCKYINRIILGSDSEEMLTVGKNAGAETVRRPDFYCDESQATANDMIKNMMELISTDIVVWSHCTNPLLSSQTYDDAVETYLNNTKEYDSLLSVHEIKEHLWDYKKHVVNYNPYSEKHTPARDLPPYYIQDGGIFIQPYNQMKQNSYFFGEKPYLYVIPDNEFLDINTNREYILAKAILENKPIT